MTEKIKSKISDLHAQIVLDSIADGVFTVNRDMIITHFNKSAERITRVPVEKALGQYCFEVLRSSVCETKCPLKCSFKTGENIINRQNKILRADSREIPISLSTAAIKDESGKVIGGVQTFRDLSDSETIKNISTKNPLDDNGSNSQNTFDSLNITELVGEKKNSGLNQHQKASADEFPLLKHAEKNAIIEVLNKYNWNIIRTAGVLGIDRTTLWRKMKKFNISKS